jgi:nucleotide-binding universal stress UspA family protein
MTEIRRILVPVDFSEHSRAALDYASGLARLSGAAVDVLHVWQIPAFEPPGPIVAEARQTLWEAAQSNAEQALAGFCEAASKRQVAVRGSRAVAGSPVMAIVDAAKAGDYDLIVLGTHGRTGLARALIGSVAERVVRHAHCPVLAVRSPAVG